MSKNRIKKLIEPYVIREGRRFKLKDIDPGDSGGFKTDKPLAEKVLEEGVNRLCNLQEKLYAQDRWAVLLIFQAMDAAGKDGAIKHVMSGINPQGCQVYSFKQPSTEELDHDFLWRCVESAARARPHRHLQSLVLRRGARRARAPARSSAAEAPASARHEAHLEGAVRGHQRASSATWRATAYAIRKFFLHVSKKEQGKRFSKRTRRAGEAVEVLSGDLREREHWNEYMTRTKTRFATPRPSTLRGWSCRPTRNGSRGGSWPPRSSMPWKSWTWRFRKLRPKSERSWTRVAGCSGGKGVIDDDQQC